MVTVGHFFGISSVLHTLVECVYIKPHSTGDNRQLCEVEPVAPRRHLVHSVDKAEEGRATPLRARTLGGSRLLRRLGVYLRQWEVAEYPCHLPLLAVEVHHLMHGGVEVFAIRALEVGVLYDHDTCLWVPEDIVCARLVGAHSFRLLPAAARITAPASPKHRARNKEPRDHDSDRQCIVIHPAILTDRQGKANYTVGMETAVGIGVGFAFFILLLAFGQLVVVFVDALQGRAPFVPVSRRRVEHIVKALQLKPHSVLYDLGSGDGRVVLAAAAREPQSRAIGVERSLLPSALAHAARWRRRVPNATYLRQDMFSTPLTGATHVFCYLFAPMMPQLEAKLEQELQHGARVVSCTFPLPTKHPLEVIDLEGAGLGSRLFVYEY